MKSLSEALSKALSRASFPLFDRWDRSDRGEEWRRLARSQWLSATEIEALQRARLKAALRHAYDTVPYYRTAWQAAPPVNSLADLRTLPILTKQQVRDAGEALLSTALPRESLITAKTGGSTGTALKLYFDHDTQQHRNAAALRSDSWAGWEPGQWIGALWGSPEYPSNLKQHVRNWLRERFEYLDTMRLDPASMDAFLERMRERPLEALFGHAHSLYILADYVQKSGASVPAPKAIVSTSMMLIASERAVIEAVFRCKVTDRYGCEEVGLIAAECERHEGLHVNAEHTLVEIVDDDGHPAAPGVIGRVLVTDLLNKGMPLIRYEVGDLSAWSPVPCSCGRGLKTLTRVVGRQADCLVRRDGSLVAGVSLVERTLTAIPGIAQLQLVQPSPTEVTAHTVADPAATTAWQAELHSALARDLGDGIDITVVPVERIPQEANGKYRFAIRRF